MKRATSIALLVVGLLTMRCVVLPRILPAGHVEYRGQTIQLSKWYFDYDDYKNDPDNIAPNERERVARLVTTAPVATSFSSRLEMIRATSAVRFPGYGSSQFGERVQPDGSVLTGYSVEVPQANKERVFVFRGNAGKFVLVDELVVSEDLRIMGVREEAGEFVFTTLQGTEVLRRPAKEKERLK